MGSAEGGKGGELDDGANRPLEEDRKHDDVEGSGLAETGVDPHIVAGDLGQQDPLLFLGALAHQALADVKRGGEMPALLEAVSGLKLQHRVTAV